MENVVLIVHLILALALIAVVLLQRSEGGGLGMGGGGGGGVSSRGQVTALGKLTWAFGVAFTATSITLTIIAAQNSADTSVIDRLGIEAPAGDTSVPAPAGDLLPPPAGGGLVAPPPVE
ncbi:MAG: preprotein translocase subunit SecG [Pseudomonadota bacterium]